MLKNNNNNLRNTRDIEYCEKNIYTTKENTTNTTEWDFQMHILRHWDKFFEKEWQNLHMLRSKNKTFHRKEAHVIHAFYKEKKKNSYANNRIIAILLLEFWYFKNVHKQCN